MTLCLFFCVAVSRYFATTDVAYLARYTEIEWSLSCEIQI